MFRPAAKPAPLRPAPPFGAPDITRLAFALTLIRAVPPPSRLCRALALLACLSGALPCAAAPLTFQNGDRHLTLLPQDGEYLVQEAGVRVLLSDRLIVKVRADLDSAALRAALGGDVLGLTELYAAADFRYLLLESGARLPLAERLALVAAQPGVLQVQPDLAQSWEAAPVPVDASWKDRSPPSSGWLASPNRGAGVRIALIDDGVDLAHAELAGVHIVFAYDFESHALNASPRHPRDSHGTRVAGILLAARDGRGVEGLAPDAELIAIRQPDTWTSNTLRSFMLAKLEGADLVVCAWTSGLLLSPVAEAVRDLALSGRGGKGAAVIFAAGNEGREIVPLASEAAIAEALVIGAADENGRTLSHSNHGPSVDFLAFGEAVASLRRGGGHAPLAGSSLAAALVAGRAAQLLGATPELTLAELGAILRRELDTPAPAQTSPLPPSGAPHHEQ